MSATESPRPSAVLVGKRIRELRLSLNLSKYALAKGAHISQSTVRELEQGKYLPSLETLFAFVEAMGLSSVEEVLTGRRFGTTDIIESVEREADVG